MEDNRVPAVDSVTKEFSTVRKGYDPVEVEQYLAEQDRVFQDLEDYTARLKRELHEARLEIAGLHAAEQDSIDNAMLAVFDAKDRILAEATQRATQIEDQARSKAGLPVESQSHVAEPRGGDVGKELLEDLAEVMSEPEPSSLEPNDVLHKMLEEAESIRIRLDDGLASAFDQMEQMQKDAELRAAALLANARREAGRLRASGDPEPQTSIDVALTDGDSMTERPSRYSRNSARLPRIGDEDGASVLAKMNNLRTKMREDDAEADSDTTTPHDATG